MNDMKSRIAFRNKVDAYLKTLDERTLSYNKDEYWMIFSVYEFLEYYSFENRLWNTCIALPLARGLHDGTYRRSSITKNGSTYRLPYVIHCLYVCRMLADLNIPISLEEKDILLASALCHDMIEDLPFPKHGLEIVEESCNTICFSFYDHIVCYIFKEYHEFVAAGSSDNIINSEFGP